LNIGCVTQCEDAWCELCGLAIHSSICGTTMFTVNDYKSM